MTLLKSVSSGDRRAGLEAMRDALAASMELADPSVMAQIAGQLRQVMREIDEMPAVEEGKSKRDELADRRKDRRAAAATVAPAAGGHV